MDKARKLHFRLTYGAWVFSVFGWFALIAVDTFHVIALQPWAIGITAVLWLVSFVILTGAIYIQLQIEKAEKRSEQKVKENT